MDITNKRTDRKVLFIERIHQIIADHEVSNIVFAEPSTVMVENALNPGRARILMTLEGCRHNLLARRGKIEKVPFSKGMVLFAGSQTWHKPVPGSYYVMFSVIFDPEYTLFSQKSVVLGQKENPELTYHAPPLQSGPLYHLVKTLETMPEDLRFSETAHRLLQTTMLFSARFLEQSDEIPGRSRNTWQRIMNHMRENFHTALTRDSVADHFKFHPNHISRIFKENQHGSFVRTLGKLRLEHAKILLQQSNLSIKEIAALSGFSSANYFTRAFRKEYGILPSESGLPGQN